MKIQWRYPGSCAALRQRELLGVAVSIHHERLLNDFNRGADTAEWSVQLGDTLLFDRAGVELIAQAITKYQGDAGNLKFVLKLEASLFRDYYSLQPRENVSGSCLALPVTARRNGSEQDSSERIEIELPTSPDLMTLPSSLGGPMQIAVPEALLLPYTNDFDLLFANQIAVLSELRQRVRRSPLAWVKGCIASHRRGSLRQRIALGYQAIHPSAVVHPTAVIEGSVISAGVRIGAHCTVRYSLIGPNATLEDGAKVEFSVVGGNSWLMHDLVLYRSVTEEGVFLIHGPYQFSLFQRRSAAFATILMDYRPDGKSIQVKTPAGLLAYQGRFLGSVLQEGARTLGGCSLAPGRIVPPETWLAASDIHTRLPESLPARTPLSPTSVREESYENNLR